VTFAVGPVSQDEDEDWWCEYRVTKRDGQVLAHGNAPGADSMQALTGALIALSVESNKLKQEFDIQWHGRLGYFVLNDLFEGPRGSVSDSGQPNP
jgi:hypothetical protein